MNNNFMLQNLIESDRSVNFADSKPKKHNKMGTHQLQLQIGTIFNEVCQLLQDNNMPVDLQQIPKTTDKINMFKDIVQQLIGKTHTHQESVDNSNAITCPDCQTYEASLQKLQNQVRQHIRLEQQLKIFQDTQDEKMEEYKKEKKTVDKKIEQLRKQLEDSKKMCVTLTQKNNKLEHQNQQYKKELREVKRSVSTHQDVINTKRESHKQSAYGYESKENKIDWVHRNISIKKDEKEKHYERKSIQKRNDSADKNWRMSANAKSNKMISVMNDKLIQDKTRDERRKVIQSKFDYRR